MDEEDTDSARKTWKGKQAGVSANPLVQVELLKLDMNHQTPVRRNCLLAFQLNLHQGTASHKGFQFALPSPLRNDLGENLSSRRFIGDGNGSRWQVGVGALLQVKRKLRVRQQIGIPIASTGQSTSPAGRPGCRASDRRRQ